MLSIDSAPQVDLVAQSNVRFVRRQIYSGFGGEPDVVSGALLSRDDQAVLVPRRWHDATDSSNIAPLVTAPVRSLQRLAIVTERTSPRSLAPPSARSAAH